jgi:hypothetical protein
MSGAEDNFVIKDNLGILIDNSAEALKLILKEST